jgi:hypothetical protein
VKMTVSQVIMSPEKWLDNYNKMAALRAKRG